MEATCQSGKEASPFSPCAVGPKRKITSFFGEEHSPPPKKNERLVHLKTHLNWNPEDYLNHPPPRLGVQNVNFPGCFLPLFLDPSYISVMKLYISLGGSKNAKKCMPSTGVFVCIWCVVTQSMVSWLFRLAVYLVLGMFPIWRFLINCQSFPMIVLKYQAWTQQLASFSDSNPTAKKSILVNLNIKSRITSITSITRITSMTSIKNQSWQYNMYIYISRRIHVWYIHLHLA